MSDLDQTFGERLYSEMRKQSGYNLITAIMNYNAIQQLKVSDRHDTLKLFSGSGYEIIQLLKNGEPEDVARRLVAAAKDAQVGDTGLETAMMIMINTF